MLIENSYNLFFLCFGIVIQDIRLMPHYILPLISYGKIEINFFLKIEKKFLKKKERNIERDIDT